MAAKETLRTVQHQPCWRLASDNVEAFVTEQGGHLAPVTFDRRNRKIRPYSVAPWAGEKVSRSVPTIVRILRGDFFCMPFGGNDLPYRGEKHPVHGETANAKWRFESLSRTAGRTCLHLSLRTRIRRGRVDKRITLIDGHNAVYCQHVISGATGPMNVGHHATLKFPAEPDSGLISTSPFKLGQVYPEPVEDPAQGGYSILKPGAVFKSLGRVPTMDGQSADLSRYPARRGFEDLVQILSDPRSDIAWTAVTFPKQRYVWFAMKDPRVLNGTIFWISNGGRHYAPWNGRHISVMGLEEVTSYFHVGLAQSARKNPFNKQGWQTILQLKPHQPTVVNYIMGVTLIPAGFDRVKQIDTHPDRIILKSVSGKHGEVPLDTGFLRSAS